MFVGTGVDDGDLAGGKRFDGLPLPYAGDEIFGYAPGFAEFITTIGGAEHDRIGTSAAEATGGVDAH
ncbi:MAG: hypothetical protein KDN22_18090 [Verrucomicrobiae bacterium]|nr:hypothetical protein [Verrucomicrobiae bacterium]